MIIIDIRWILYFNYDELDIPIFIDNLDINKDWSYVSYRNKSLRYNDRCPQINNYIQSEFVIFNKYRVFRMNKDNCSVITSNIDLTVDDFSYIIKHNSYNIKVYTKIYKFNFDFHALITVISTIEKIRMNENDYVFLTKAYFVYNKVNVTIVANSISWSTDSDIIHKQIIELCNEIEYRYNEDSKSYIDIFNRLTRYCKDTVIDKVHINPSYTHLSLDYQVWYRASRENQRLWPIISTTKINDNSILFNNNYYTNPDINGIIKLKDRYDDNPYKYIPTCYTNRNTNTIDKVIISNIIKKKCINNGEFIKAYKHNNEPCIRLDDTGKFINTDINPLYIVYNNNIIAKYKGNEGKDVMINDIQVLDNNWNRVKILRLDDNNEYIHIDNSGVRVNNVITIPYHYKQIVHDYNMLGRLVYGKYMDLTHIGIVDIKGKDIITFPYDKDRELYNSNNLETSRLLTYRYKYSVYHSIE